MRPRRIVFAAAIALAVVACTDTPTTPTDSVDGFASAITQRRRIPAPFRLENECTGEFISGDGTFHQVRTITDDGNGGFHITRHGNFSNLRAVGETSGTEYRAQQILHNSDQVRPPFPRTLTVHNSVRFVAKKNGGGAFTLKGDFKLVINANGDVVVLENNFPRTLECR